MASSDARITAREVIDAVVAAEAESDEPLIASTSCQTDDSFLTDVSDLREQLDAVRKDLGVSAAACDNFQNKLRFELPRALESLKEQYRARQRKLVEEHKIELDRRSRQQQAAAEVLVKNRELEVRSECENHNKEQLEMFHKELLEREKYLQDKLESMKKQGVLKDQSMDEMRAQILHLEAKIESQVLIGDEESIEQKLNQYKSQLESSQNITEALRQELFRRQSEFTAIANKNRKLEGGNVELERALRGERDDKITLKSKHAAEKETLLVMHNKQIVKMSEELKEARERANAIYQDYERESQITDIMVNRYQTIITKLKEENRVLRTTLVKSAHDGSSDGRAADGFPGFGDRPPSITERLYSASQKKSPDVFLKETPAHAPNPLAVNQKLKSMSSMHLHLENIQNQVRNKLKTLNVEDHKRMRPPRPAAHSAKGRIITRKAKRLAAVSDAAPTEDVLMWSAKATI